MIDCEKVRFSLEKFKILAAQTEMSLTDVQVIAKDAVTVLEAPHETTPNPDTIIGKAAYSMQQAFTGRPWFKSVEVEMKHGAPPILVLNVRRKCIESDAVGTWWAGFPVRVEVAQ